MALSEKIISLNFSFQQVTEDYTVVKNEYFIKMYPEYMVKMYPIGISKVLWVIYLINYKLSFEAN